MEHNLLSLLGYMLLGASLLSLWVSRHPAVWGSILGVGMLLGLASAQVGWVGVAQVLVLGLLVHTYYTRAYTRALAPKVKVTLGLTVVALSLGFFSHWLPGFGNLTVLSDVQLSPDSLPYSMSLSWDKPLVGLSILAFGPALARSRGEWRLVLRTLLSLLGLTAVVMISGALASGYIRWDPKFPEVVWIWAMHNLLLTCVAEEALFRGFIQRELSSAMAHYSWGSIVAVIVSSVLFGLAHFAGGTMYVVLAGVAGALYGAAYLKSGRIESSILLHFTLNLVHFLGFSYPALQV